MTETVGPLGSGTQKARASLDKLMPEISQTTADLELRSVYFWGDDWKLKTKDNTTAAEWAAALKARKVFGLD